MKINKCLLCAEKVAKIPLGQPDFNLIWQKKIFRFFFIFIPLYIIASGITEHMIKGRKQQVTIISLHNTFFGLWGSFYIYVFMCIYVCY